MAKRRNTAGSERAQALARLPLMEFIAEASKDFENPEEPGGLMEPVHLRPFVDVLTRTETEPVRVVSSVPVQHGKTTTLQYFIVWRILRNPKISAIYSTYGQEFTSANAVVMRQIAERCGIEFDEDMNTIKRWKTVQGGGLLSTSIGGPITGWPARLLVVDDYYANREEAESVRHRDIVERWFNADAQSRVGPTGSIIVNASRRHVNDLSGYLLNRKKGRLFEGMNLPAISEAGEALCPWGPDPEDPRTIEFLRSTQEEIGDYDFESLYQGNPMPAAGKMFNDPTFGAASAEGRLTIGVDLSYTDSAASDSCAYVVLKWADERRAHIVEGGKWKGPPDELKRRLRSVFSNYEGVTKASFVSGPEKAVYRFMAREDVNEDGTRSPGVNVTLLDAKDSKQLRAQDTANAWNAGRLTATQGAPYLNDLTGETNVFTGKNDAHDDMVDALVSAFEAGKLGANVAGGRMVRPLRR